jgi:hypothetical protein
MFICRGCAEVAGVNGMLRSWGCCEMCNGSATYCFDIPAALMPKACERLATEVIEELFGLARERRLLAATHETDELACHEEELTRAIAAVSASMLPKVVRELVVMLDQVSYANGLITKGR